LGSDSQFIGCIKGLCFFQDGTRGKGFFGELNSRASCVMPTPYLAVHACELLGGLLDGIK